MIVKNVRTAYRLLAGLALAAAAGVQAQSQTFIYPSKGQTPDQQANDKHDCSGWATQQTGFDPVQALQQQQAQTAQAQQQSQQAQAQAQAQASSKDKAPVVGTVGGAAVGAGIGAIAGNAGKGAAIGEVTGLVASGGAAGTRGPLGPLLKRSTIALAGKESSHGPKRNGGADVPPSAALPRLS